MIGIAGAGAFGTALAVALAADGRDVRLWGRNLQVGSRKENPRLPGIAIPDRVQIVENVFDLAKTDAVLLVVPMQALRGFLSEHAAVLNGRPLVACSKGLDLETLRGPTSLIGDTCPASVAAVLTGPSFAADIARGLPTALTLACEIPEMAERLQTVLSTPVLRLYRSADVIGAELGGALKNVIAIAAGIVIGAGLGESARAALMTRGYAEMERFAVRLGAKAETLAGLSGFGDLVLTCCSAQSRNFQYGLALGQGAAPDASATIEGLATAQAVTQQAIRFGCVAQMPITTMVAAVVTGRHTVAEAVQALMSRPLKQE